MERRGNAKYSACKRFDEPGSLASDGMVVHSRTFSTSLLDNYPRVVTIPE